LCRNFFEVIKLEFRNFWRLFKDIVFIGREALGTLQFSLEKMVFLLQLIANSMFPEKIASLIKIKK